MRSLATGFVDCRLTIPDAVIDDSYAMLARFFHLPRDDKLKYVRKGSVGQAGYTGLLVEAAAHAEKPDGKEMLNWGIELRPGHPLRRAFPHRYMERVFPDGDVPGIGAALFLLYDRLLDLQRRVLRIMARGIRCASARRLSRPISGIPLRPGP